MDTQIYAALESRELGQAGVSMGSSLAIESLFGIYPEAEQSPPPIRNYDQIYINIATLIRNLINTLDAQKQKALDVELILEFTIEEMRTIDAWVTDQTNARVKVFFYYNDRSRIARVFPHANVKDKLTSKQLLLATLEKEAVRLIFKQRLDVKTSYFQIHLHPNPGRTAINTHVILDLLSYRRFDKLDLVESHTGVIRKTSSWGHKLTVKDQSLPFNPYTYQVFGDNRDIKPVNKNEREAIVEIARKRRWSPTTTLDKIDKSLDDLENQQMRQFHKRLLSSARSFPTFG